MIRGKLIELNASTGAIKHTFYTLPRGCIGAAVWGSPAIDTADNAVYFATGNANACSKSEPYSIAVVKLNATSLSHIDSWQVPTNQQTSDGDFGSTPTLFQASIGGKMHNLVGVANKNGVYYAFDRTNLHQGPVWQAKIADSIGGGCGPTCGQGSISPSSWDGTTLFVAGGNTVIHGNSCMGGLSSATRIQIMVHTSMVRHPSRMECCISGIWMILFTLLGPRSINLNLRAFPILHFHDGDLEREVI